MSPRDIRRGLEGLIGRGMGFLQPSQPRYEVITSERGVIVNFNGTQLASSVIDRPYFVHEWFTPAQLDVAAKFEQLVQGILKPSGPRKYSGLWPYSHIDGVVETGFETAKQAGVSLDFVTLLAFIGHDAIEDHPDLRALHRKWEETVFRGNDEDRIRYTHQLKLKRLGLRNYLGAQLDAYISKVAYASPSEKDALGTDARKAVDLIYGLTKYSNELWYVESLQRVFRRNRNEEISQMLRRAVIKNFDRTSNLIEYHPLLSYGAMRQINLAFNDPRDFDGSSLGQDLSNRLGGIELNAQDMPAAVMVGTGVNSIFALHFFNEMQNDYERGIARGDYGPMPQELLRLLNPSRDREIEATLNLARAAVNWYERNGIDDEAEARADEIAEINRRSSYYDRITSDGPAGSGTWVKRGAWPNEMVAALDRQQHTIIQNYSDARDILEMVPRFGLVYCRAKKSGDARVLVEDTTEYDPKRHIHFTLEGMDAFIKGMPDYWASVAKLPKPAPHGGRRAFTSVVF